MKNIYTVYTITDIYTKKVIYVGKTKNFKKRKQQHLQLKTNTKQWISMIGVDNISIDSVHIFNNNIDAIRYEDELINKYHTITNGYNKQRSGNVYKDDNYIKSYNKQYKKVYRTEHNAEMIQYDKQYRAMHRDEMNEKKREYRKTPKYKIYKSRRNDIKLIKKLLPDIQINKISDNILLVY